MINPTGTALNAVKKLGAMLPTDLQVINEDTIITPQESMKAPAEHTPSVRKTPVKKQVSFTREIISGDYDNFQPIIFTLTDDLDLHHHRFGGHINEAYYPTDYCEQEEEEECIF